MGPHAHPVPERSERVADAAVAPRRRARLSVERCVSFEGLRGEWDELAAGGANVFATWEWATTWWRHFGRGRPLLVTTCRARGGRLVAVLPLYLASARPLRIVRFVGHGPGDQLGPVCRPDDRAAAAWCLRRALVDLRCDLFLGEHLLREEGWSALLGGRVLRTEGSPVLTLAAGSWDELLSGWSPNLRKKVRQYARKLEREHGLRFRLGGEERLEEDLETLFALHRARFGATAYAGRHAAFHREFAALARDLGWLRLWILEVDGRPAAAMHVFRFAGVESNYQVGRDPSWAGPGIGTALTAHSIRAALEDGMREYRFLRGGEAYKYRFASHDPGLETIAVARGTLAGAALAAGALLPERLADVLRRLAG
jgi:CelD/BcsL family acetyltransferase involved in cellulose biosynthesis